MSKKQDKELSDADILSHAFRDVTPLPGRQISYTSRTSFKSINSQDSRTPIRRNALAKRLTAPKQPEVEYQNAPTFGKRTSRRLRQGRIGVQATLDLHGLRQDEAHKVLNEFLVRASDSGKRCVLVITGKGTLSQGGGVLKNMVPRWLTETPNRARISSFTQARPKDGGTGALFILLKGKRT